MLGRAVEAYSERRKYLGLADLRCDVLFTFVPCPLTLGHWAAAGTLLYLGACHVGCRLGKDDRGACINWLVLQPRTRPELFLRR